MTDEHAHPSSTSKNADPKVTDLSEEADRSMLEQDEEGDLNSTAQLCRGRVKQTRMEKKSRKALSRFGLKPVEGIIKVTIRKSKHLLFSITNPEVFKSPTSDVYIIFGDAKIDDGTSQPTTSANKYPLTNFANCESAPTETWTTSQYGQEEEQEKEAGSLDMTGLEERDVQLVMAQCQCKRTEAIAALRKNNNDLVESIMSLSAC